MIKLRCKRGNCDFMKSSSKSSRKSQVGFGIMGKIGSGGLFVDGTDYVVPLVKVQNLKAKKSKPKRQTGRGRKRICQTGKGRKRVSRKKSAKASTSKKPRKTKTKAKPKTTKSKK